MPSPTAPASCTSEKEKWVGLHKPDFVPSASRPPAWSFIWRPLSGPLSAHADCDYYPELSTPFGACGQAGLSPVLSCTARGLSCLLPYGQSGGLLPRLFTLAHLRRSSDGRFVFCDTFHCPGLLQNLQRLRAARCLAVSGLSSRPRILRPRRATTPADPQALYPARATCQEGFCVPLAVPLYLQ